jgi:hypothetical protein
MRFVFVLLVVCACGGGQEANTAPVQKAPVQEVSPPPPAKAQELDVPTRITLSDAERDNFIARASSAAVETILPAGTAGNAPASQDIATYIESIVSTNGHGRLVERRAVQCTKPPDHQCVALVGRGCPEGVEDEDCEGLDLLVVIDVSSDPPSLSYAQGSYGPVLNQDDVELQLDKVP